MNSPNLTMVVATTILESIFIGSIFFISSPFFQQVQAQSTNQPGTPIRSYRLPDVAIVGARDGNDVLLTNENGRTNSTSITIGFQGISHGSDIGIKN